MCADLTDLYGLSSIAPPRLLLLSPLTSKKKRFPECELSSPQNGRWFGSKSQWALMWVQVGSLYRVLELVLRRQKDGFMKCPACKGFGSTITTRNQIVFISRCPSSACLCQFCEGFKILPMTGLTEFIPVRAATYLQVQDCLRKEPGICWKPRRPIGKRKNFLRKKIVEEAEARARCILTKLNLTES